jgi:hypothetical protein
MKRTLLAVAVVLTLTGGGCQRYYIVEYRYAVTPQRFDARAGRTAIHLKIPAGTTVSCRSGRLIDENNIPSIALCSRLKNIGEMPQADWNVSLVSEVTGPAEISVVAAVSVYPWPGDRVRFVPLLRTGAGPRNAKMSADAEEAHAIGRENIGKKVVLELKDAGRIEFTAVGYELKGYPL